MVDQAHGGFGWNELATTDVAACKAFYSGLLGWTMRDMSMGEGMSYTVVSAGGKDIGGMMKMDGP